MIIPDFCYALNNMTINPKTGIGKVIQIKALEKGYYPTSIEETQEFVDDFNKIHLGIPKATAWAMYDASVFGWDCYLNILKSYQARMGELDTESE